MNFDLFERKIGYIFNKNLYIRNFIKLIYKSFFFLFSFHHKKYKSVYKLKMYDYMNQESFFGYYDKSPINVDQTHVIFCSVPYHTSKSPNPNMHVLIILKNLKTNTKKLIHKCYSFNLQQGVRLQWIDNDKFIFNDYSIESNKYISIVYSVKELSKKVIEYPIYDLFKDKYAISLKFESLYKFQKDYGYKNIKSYKFNLNEIAIYKYNLNTHTIDFSISFDELINIKYLKSMNTNSHYVNHIMISPNGNYFIFLHRWINGTVENSRLLIYSIKSNELSVLINNAKISHYCWKDNDDIIIYFKSKKYDYGWYTFNIHKKKESIISSKLNNINDGHPSICKNKLIIDSYPNRFSFQNLYLYSFNKNQLKNVAKIYHPLKYYSETRCDLHPRWNINGDKLFFDSVFNSRRKLYSININNEV